MEIGMTITLAVLVVAVLLLICLICRWRRQMVIEREIVIDDAVAPDVVIEGVQEETERRSGFFSFLRR